MHLKSQSALWQGIETTYTQWRANTDMNIKIVLAAIIVLTLLVACGPASPTGQNGGGENQSKPPTPTNQDAGPSDPPTPQPTSTPNPPPDVDPTPTPKPEPTRHPNDPLPQPEKATVVVPPPSNGETSVDLPILPKPPNGIEGCYTINLYSSTAQELDYAGWCFDALLQDVSANCAGIGNSEDELRCAQQRLSKVQTYFMREVGGTPCAAISDPDDRLQCFQDAALESQTHMTILWSTWASILNTVDSNAQVKAAHVAMADCVEQRGFTRPAPGESIAWQESKAPDAPKTVRGEMPLAQLEAIDQCANEVGLYTAQETVWLSEIYRLHREDPEKVRPLIEDGILPALEADGPALFLTLRQ